MKKKLLSLILAVLMLANIGIPAYATDTDEQESENGSAIDNIISMTEIETQAAGLIGMAISDPYNTRFNPGSYSLGEEIPTYVVEGASVNDFEEAIYYPVYCDGNPIGIFTINGANTSDPTYSFGGDFIDNLKDAVLDSNRAYSLVVAEHQIFAVTTDSAVEVVKYDASPMKEVIAPSTAAMAFSDPDGPIEAEFIEIPNDDFQYIVFESSDILSIIENQILETADTISQSKLMLPRTTRAWKAVGAVPRATQPSGSNWCWAYTSWSIGEFMNGKTNSSTSFNHTVKSLVTYRNKNHGDFGSSDDIEAILKNKYSLPNAHTYASLTNAQMKKWLDKKQPFSMNCYTTKGLGHVVTCYGYDGDFSPIKLGVMDSLTADPNQYRYMTSPSSGTEYKITCGNNTYIYSGSTTPTSWNDVK